MSMETVQMSFRPMSRKVHELLMEAFEGEPVQAYCDLLTATLMSAEFFKLPNDAIHKHIALIRSNVDAAIAAHPEIFGDVNGQPVEQAERP